MGGVARRAAVINQERATGVNLLVLDAGDSWVGDRDPAKKSQGQTSVAAMNMLGYDAMALGPKELALGLDVLRQRMAEAEFAVLSANAVVADTGELIALPYVVRAFGQFRVAIIGLSGGMGNAEIAVRDPIESLEALMPQVSSQAQVVIVLSHAGPAVDQQIAARVPGIHLIVSGGAQFEYSSAAVGPSGTLLVHADEASSGHAGRHMGIARLVFDARGGIVTHQWRRLALRPEVGEEPEVSEWVWAQTRP